MKLLLVISSAFLVGCSSPVTVKQFKSHAEMLAHGRTIPNFPEFGSFAEVQVAILAHHHLYAEEAQQKRQELRDASEVRFYSSVVGVLGGLAKSVTTAAAGALGATGANIYTERYKLEVQAHNYEMAVAALGCMYGLLSSSDQADLKNLKINALSSTTVDAVFRDAAASSLAFVRARIASLQSKLQFGQPDLSKLRESVKMASDSVTRGGNTAAAAGIDVSSIDSYRRNLKQCESHMGT